MSVKIVDIRDKTPTDQEVFDFVSAHLFAQGRPARTDGSVGPTCVYRLPKNGQQLACAAGCTFRDDEYNPLMEGSGSVGRLHGKNMLPERLVPVIPILALLQEVHDNPLNMVSEHDSLPYEDRPFHEGRLREGLTEVAKKFKLDTSILDQLQLAPATV